MNGNGDPDSRRGTVLVAEDNDSLRPLVQRMLEGAGYAVLTANSGTDALRVAGEHDGPIDVLVSDVVMPGLRGPELARRLEAEYPRMRVVLMSGYTDEPVERTDVKFLAKPFQREALLAAVAGLLADES